MSIPVDLAQLRDEAAKRGTTAFLVTVTADARPHVVEVMIAWEGDVMVMSAGRTTVANAAERTTVTMLWPPTAPGEYSLIADGTATVEPGDAGGTVTVRPSKAVLHRPATDDHPATRPGCTADCVPLDGS
ncbi:MAG: pyridoxamine 5'-phosphate oxidase family protein [Actinomycetota bacterium]|nr:pyridoxamine 5'-phosphate oxidase family protein [Actinomycetota bacterium]